MSKTLTNEQMLALAEHVENAAISPRSPMIIRT